MGVAWVWLGCGLYGLCTLTTLPTPLLFKRFSCLSIIRLDRLGMFVQLLALQIFSWISDFKCLEGDTKEVPFHPLT